MEHDPIELECGCKVNLYKDGEWRLQWAWPCKDHQGEAPYCCDVARLHYTPSMKLHGCVRINCKTCNAEYCPHWPMCPKCMIQKAAV